MPKSAKTIKVLGIGEAVIDSTILVEDNSTNLPSKYVISSEDIGGSILSALVVLARLGISCTFITSIGTDTEGKKIESFLKAEKIELINYSQNPTKKNLILVNQTDGSRQKKRGSTIHHLIKNIEQSSIKDYQYVMIDRHQRDAFYEIVEKKDLKTKIIIDPSTEVSDFTLDMIKFSDFPIVPIETLEELASVAGSLHSLSWLYELCKKPLTITAGKIGSYIFDGQSLKYLKSFPSSAVDVTGAGDTFRGAFTFGLIQKWPLEKAALFGNYVAALQCQKIGNVGAIPSAIEMNNFHKNNFLNKVEYINIKNKNQWGVLEYVK